MNIAVSNQFIELFIDPQLSISTIRSFESPSKQISGIDYWWQSSLANQPQNGLYSGSVSQRRSRADWSGSRKDSLRGHQGHRISTWNTPVKDRDGIDRRGTNIATRPPQAAVLGHCYQAQTQTSRVFQGALFNQSSNCFIKPACFTKKHMTKGYSHD